MSDGLNEGQLQMQARLKGYQEREEAMQKQAD